MRLALDDFERSEGLDLVFLFFLFLYFFFSELGIRLGFIRG